MAEQNYEQALTHLEKAVKGNTVPEDVYLNYVEVLLLNKHNVLAKRKIQQRKFELESSLKKLAMLKSKYKLED